MEELPDEFEGLDEEPFDERTFESNLGPENIYPTQKEASVDENPFDRFPEEVQRDVEGLTWLGHLSEDYEFCGHHITLRTLRGDEELAAGKVAAEYAGTAAEAKAYAWAHVGLALTQVDGDDNFCPPAGPDREAFARARFRWVSSRWFWPTCEYWFSQYVDLMRRQIKAYQAMQDLSQRSLGTS